MMHLIIGIGGLAFAVLALVLFPRLVKGPTMADRMLAVDEIDNLVCLMLVFYSIYTGRSIYLDIAIVTALLGFISTVFVGRYLERRI